ncbi:SUKH-3 domain-containing protein [uncultured Thiothrix sp.]|uniref:SUKH-3 domain-containing protein n=1 Tax=uncultured Thiothrix sp. TaxID=223185 RepID=UPI0026270CD4|nr:SUKH-3 domain-containing protein [uncultured Thiothrix sp.]
MIYIPERIQHFFISVGWAPNMRQHSTESQTVQSIFTEFGGLEVGACGAGLECAASNVCFFTCYQEHKHVVVEPWVSRLGPLTAIAEAHHDHISVFANREGAYYFYTHPDDQLYLGGTSFGEAMERLLLGQQYGRPIEPCI